MNTKTNSPTPTERELGRIVANAIDASRVGGMADMMEVARTLAATIASQSARVAELEGALSAMVRAAEQQRDEYGSATVLLAHRVGEARALLGGGK